MRIRFGSSLEFESQDGESILELARRVNFPLAAGCFNGGCGVCKIHLSSGKVRLGGALSREKLSREEELEGYMLACRAVAETDIMIDQYTRFRRVDGWRTMLEFVSLHQRSE